MVNSYGLLRRIKPPRNDETALLVIARKKYGVFVFLTRQSIYYITQLMDCFGVQAASQ
ncbi:MAG: hypothetical protein LBC96_07520 [Lachnospiraceae bacterium]|nr:hypothetical protein [Lachnospiraceae bacterium]